MNKDKIIYKLVRSKALLQQNFHIAKLGLFGSYAKDTPHVGSDVDLVVEFEEGVRLGFREWYNLEVFFQQILETDKVDIVNAQFINPLVKSEMVKSVVYV